MLEANKIIFKREDILKLCNEEAIMEYYLGLTPTHELVKNPLRKDNNPGCSF